MTGTTHKDALEFGDSRERIIASMGGWVADFVRAVANDDREAVYLLLARLRPAQSGIGVDATAALLLLADIAGHADPGLVAEATGRPAARAPAGVTAGVIRPVPETRQAA